MGTYPGLDYRKFAKELDVVSWDNYPSWHSEENTWELASRIAFTHDLNRSLKGGKPFMLMESTPSLVNWQPVNKLKRPGMHLLSSLQAVAHGSDTVQYFQWRKSRGSAEKLHGAVVDHCGHENTRVFREVAEVGAVLKQLDPVLGTTVKPDVAILYDWENRWAIDDAQALRRDKKDYEKTCQDHYRAFWQRGVPADVIGMDDDFSGYKLLVAPMLYMVRPGVAERLEAFVKNGGVFVTTYFSGYVDENDLCFLGGFPGPLRTVTGIWAEEIDSLYDSDRNTLVLGAGSEYEAHTFCELIHAETAEVLATYKSDFYTGRPALTVNSCGCGKAYYIAARTENRFLEDFYGGLISELNLMKALDSTLPEGVTAQLRTDGERSYVFLMNFSEEDKTVEVGNAVFKDILINETLQNQIALRPYGVKVLERL
jgi:beta-galactosidase